MYKSLWVAFAFWACLDACQAQSASIHFLSAAESRSALTQGNGGEYFELLHIPDLRAKTGLALQDLSLEAAREQARAAYAAATLDFTAEEKAALSEAIEAVQPLLVERAPLYARTPWSFIKVDRVIGSGAGIDRQGALACASDNAVPGMEPFGTRANPCDPAPSP
jgi:hypothetical protein